MSPQLTVRNAQISTAAVEIKTLTVSGKQVTLAVFRQLIEEHLVADDGTLNGIPWGSVNYHPGKDCYARPQAGEAREYGSYIGPHLHVVWQKGSDLRRSTVLDSVEWAPFQGGGFGLFYHTCVAASLHGSLSDRWFGGKPFDSSDLKWDDRASSFLAEPPDRSWNGKSAGLRSRAEPSAAAVTAIRAHREAARSYKHLAERRDKAAEIRGNAADYMGTGTKLAAVLPPQQGYGQPPQQPQQGYPGYPQYDPGDHYKRVLESAEDDLRRAGEAADGAQAGFAEALAALDTELGGSTAELIEARWAGAVAEAHDEIARRERHADVRKALADLPQLFIAV